MIDWSRMAHPQDDGYDTAIILQHYPIATPVAVLPAPEHGLKIDGVTPAPTDHPNLSIATNYLARWPALHSQFTSLIHKIYPYSDSSQVALGKWALGSSSHSYEDDPTSLHVTVDSTLGLAQGLVHEMAHQKLRRLGVSIETAKHLITNDPSQLFASPIRKDRPRPMTAVFHAQYSFMHVTALDLYMLAGEKDEQERQHILMLLARNVPRMEAGLEEIQQHIQTDTNGRLFVDNFMNWSVKILAQGQAQLDTGGYGN